MSCTQLEVVDRAARGRCLALPLLCAASGYVLRATVTTRFTARRNEAQHINDRLYAALAGALDGDTDAAQPEPSRAFDAVFASLSS